MSMHDNTGVEKSPTHRKTVSGAESMFPRFLGKAVDDLCVARLTDVAPPPSVWNLQTWACIVVRGGVAKRHLEAATYIKVPVAAAPVVLICLADTLAWKSAPQHLEALVASHQIDENEGHEALRRVRDYYSSSPDVACRTALAKASLAVHQMLLRAAEMSLSAYCITEIDEHKIKTHFHIPDHFLVTALVPLGYSQEPSAPIDSGLSSPTFVYREKFGETFLPSRNGNS